MTLDQVRTLGPRNVLALTMDGEAGNQPVEGQIAVANVVRNRLAAPARFGKSFVEVCLARAQFSCWSAGPDCDRILAKAQAIEDGRTPNDPAFRQLLYLASGVITGELLDNAKGATHYVTATLYASAAAAPAWVAQARVVARIGDHVFMHA